ncbi:hypothetical protein CBL_01645 [Carabus blaptoides fortunei]
MALTLEKAYIPTLREEEKGNGSLVGRGYNISNFNSPTVPVGQRGTMQECHDQKLRKAVKEEKKYANELSERGEQWLSGYIGQSVVGVRLECTLCSMRKSVILCYEVMASSVERAKGDMAL